MDRCAVQRGERRVHVGAGTGYFTVVLARLVGESGSVAAYEIDGELAARARQNFRPWPWVEVGSSSGVAAPFDAVDMIYVGAAVQQPPLEWLKVLRPGGRLLFPLTPGPSEGGVLLVRATSNPKVFCAAFVCRARFIPCMGAADVEAIDRLREAFRHGDEAEVQSLVLGPTPPADAWFAGRGWSLSRDAPVVEPA